MDLTELVAKSDMARRSKTARGSAVRVLAEQARNSEGMASTGSGRQMRLPPHNLVAEASLLGAMLLSRDAIAVAMETTSADQFYRPAHAQVFDAVARLYAEGDPADPITVSEALDRSNPDAAAAVGGLDGLMGMQMQTPSTSNAASYAQIVKENFTLRRMIEAAGEIAELGYSRPVDVAEAVDRAESLMYQVAQDKTGDAATPLNALLDEALNHLAELYKQQKDVTGVATGYTDLDLLLTGLQPTSLYVVGARPSMGKTAFSIGMANHVAVSTKRPVLVFSLEMGRMELVQRLLSMEARVDSSEMRTGRLKGGAWSRISECMMTLGDAPMYIDDNPAVTIMDIRARARRLASQAGDLAMVLVDYLQLMTGRQGADNRQLEVAEISRGLKILARELNCPVVAVSQLSRNLEMRQNKRPVLADLRESGAIEQDADVVMFIYRDDVYNPDNNDTAGTAEVIVAKNRNGPTATVSLAFLARYAAFHNLADEAHSQFR